ncbi:MAG TPA: 30S ribosomal protein S4 [Candidatus Bathyarchaeia archaeon]|nr:30S ribosomal protein S4 [Candidatus Bathyarchaeia archaeon]
MTKLSAKCKLCRRAGEKLFLKGDRCNTPKCGVVRKPSPPGVHGAKSQRAKSEYGQQLAMKQRIKRIYVILERQLKKYFQEVQNKQGVIGDLLMQKLEMRFDNVIYRASLASSRRQARQLVKHSLFSLNGKNANIPSIEMKIGDKVSIKKSKADKNYFKQALAAVKENKGAGLPNWMQLDSEKMVLEIKGRPTRDDFGAGIDAQMVIEFYSR